MMRAGTYGSVVAVVVVAFAAGRLRAQQTADGWINEWLIYPPILSGFGNTPGEDNIRLDYITDGEEVFESTVLPTDAFEVEPDYFGASAGQGLANDGIDIPEFGLQIALDDTIDIAGIFGESANSVTYAVAYVNNSEEGPINALVQLGSDDSAQVKIDDCEVFIHNGGRGFGAAGEVQDQVPVILEPGPHRVLMKVFQGGGGYGFRLRFANAETGEPLTPDTEPSLDVGLDAGDFGLESIEPAGIAIDRAIDPKFIARISEENQATVTLSGIKTFADLDSNTPVVVTEVLADGLEVVAGSLAPAPTRVEGRSLIWELDVATLVADGIEYKVEVAQAGNYDVTGTYTAGEACTAATSGRTRLVAKNLVGILLGDVVGGADGLGEPTQYKAINIDNGEFMDQATVDGLDRNTNENDDPNENLNPSPVRDSDVINCVFFMPLDLPDDELEPDEFYLSVNEDGEGQVPYKFIDGDSHEVSWNGILSNNTHDRDKTTPDQRAVFVGGNDAFATGMGVHASAGITFDLGAMREAYGAENIEILTGTMGMDLCGGTVNLYVIFSDDEGVVPIAEEQDPADNRHDPDIFLLADQISTSATDVSLTIPVEAKYLTFATGDHGDGIGCDHGVFGDVRIVGQSSLLAPPTDLACSLGDNGLELSWNHAGNKDEDFEISANGQSVGSVPGDSLSTTIGLGTLPIGPLTIAVSNSQGGTTCGFLNGNEVHINCGGPRLESFVDGRTWEEDSTNRPSPFLESDGTSVASFVTGFNPAFPGKTADTSLVEPDFKDEAGNSRLFATERWKDGDLVYRIPARPGSYEVTLLFAEGCCSDGCEDLADPATSASNCRVFDIEINGQLVADQFAQHVEASLAAGIDLPNASWGIALAKGPYALQDVSEIEVAIRDLGTGNPPENASIKGISIVRTDAGAGASLKPGAVNGDGGFNISDPVAHLNFLFGGADLPECYVVPNSDPVELTQAGRTILDFNGDGGSNIADAVASLGFQFGGGAPPALGEDCVVVEGDCLDNCQ